MNEWVDGQMNGWTVEGWWVMGRRVDEWWVSGCVYR